MLFGNVEIKFKVSNCCGAYPKDLSEEMGICPDCLEHCAYVEDPLDEEEIEILNQAAVAEQKFLNDQKASHGKEA